MIGLLCIEVRSLFDVGKKRSGCWVLRGDRCKGRNHSKRSSGTIYWLNHPYTLSRLNNCANESKIWQIKGLNV